MSRLLNLVVALSVSGVAALGLHAPAAHASAGAKRALLVGELGYEGGAYPGGFHPTAGTVEAEFDSLPIALVKKVGRSGQFKIALAPGSYTVLGCGPSATTSVPSGRCSAPRTLTLASGEVDYIQLVWAYVP